MLAFSEFARLAQQGNYVPVTLTLTADLEPPVSILSRLKDDEDVFLLESVEAGERFGRNSFIGLNPRARFSVEDGRAFMEDADGRRELPEAATKEGAFMALRSLTEGLRPAAPADLPSFTAVLSVRSAGRCAVISNPKPATSLMGLRQPSWWPKI